MSVFSNTEQSRSPAQNRGKGHILVVDDDHEITEAIKYALTDRGYEVTTAQDGNLCLAIAETKNPDLIILDLMMPRRSGLLVLERLRQTTEEPVPVIVVTGNEGNRHRQYAELLGVDDYIYKPFTMDRLMSSVVNLMAN